MRCLFCKNDSTNAKSVEHIIPESLGNKTFILPLGYICDTCNNYFARKVERPFMEIPEIQQMRFKLEVPNKKNRFPKIDGVLDNGSPIVLSKKQINNEIIHILEIAPEEIEKFFVDNPTQIIMSIFTNETILKSDKIVSRFIAKMALEALALRLKTIENSLDDLIDDIKYDAIRRHARLGFIENWPCSIRRIYSFDKKWGTDNDPEQKIYEWDFLLIPIDNKVDINSIKEPILAELYFVVVIWGIEFAINMAGPEIEGYLIWLKEHNNISPLYYGKNRF